MPNKARTCRVGCVHSYDAPVHVSRLLVPPQCLQRHAPAAAAWPTCGTAKLARALCSLLHALELQPLPTPCAARLAHALRSVQLPTPGAATAHTQAALAC